MLIENEMPRRKSNYQKVKTDVEFQYAGYGRDTTFHRMYFICTSVQPINPESFEA